MYDIIFIGHNTSSSLETFKKFQEKFPTVKHVIDNGNIQEAFQLASKKSFTKMFWVVWDDLIIRHDFKFDYKVPAWDEQYIHVFKNGALYDGVCLFNKKHDVSKRELDYRFFTNKKEVDIVASNPRPYEKFTINTYEDYQIALNQSTSAMFWGVNDGLILDPVFTFDYQVPKHSQHVTHVFKNGLYYDGVCLFSKNISVSKKELDYKFFTNKKEVDVVASTPAPFDIVFMSYNEVDADKNYQALLQLHPNAKRVHGVKGIHNAHIEAAKLVNTPMFWVVDADAIIVEDFTFTYQVPVHNYNSVLVWRSKNPINGLEYGYGGVKLLPTQLTLDMNTASVDMTTSISSKFTAVEQVSNITAFNTDAFSTWRSAFRECVKLASRAITRQDYQETADRLTAWLTYNPDAQYGQEAAEGAYDGREYGRKNAADPAALSLINNFDWLQEQFNSRQVFQPLGK